MCYVEHTAYSTVSRKKKDRNKELTKDMAPVCLYSMLPFKCLMEYQTHDTGKELIGEGNVPISEASKRPETHAQILYSAIGFVFSCNLLAPGKREARTSSAEIPAEFGLETEDRECVEMRQVISIQTCALFYNHVV